MRHGLPWVTAVVCAFSGAACGGASGESEAVVTDSAGVSIVLSTSRADRLRELTSERVLALGGRDTPEESFYQAGSWNVGSDDSGNMYVLDRTGHRVQAFDPNGTHLRTLGREGAGPEELRLPFGLAVESDGTAVRRAYRFVLLATKLAITDRAPVGHAGPAACGRGPGGEHEGDVVEGRDDGVRVVRMSRTVIDGSTSRLEFEYLIGTPGGIERRSEVHELGLFTEDQVRAAFESAGLTVGRRPKVLRTRGIYIGSAA